MAGLAAAAVTSMGVVGLAAPSYADGTVTVQGTAFPDPAHADLSFVGCADLYQRTNEPLTPMVGLGPGEAPSGTRSLGWDLTGGNAVGAVFPVPSVLATTTASLEVNAAGHATGVAYAGYQQPSDAGTSLLWIGRAVLTTPGGAWQKVDATSRLYTWAKYDMSTRQQVDGDPGVPTTVAAFTATHGGDGPGFYTIGFGCDGTPFSMDTLEIGSPDSVTTYDLEGLRTSVTITSQRALTRGEVTITGQLQTETGDPIPFATMILERREPDSRQWKPVEVADVQGGVARATVPADERAFYRWRFVERPLAEGAVSRAMLLDVLPPLPSESPSPTSAPPTNPPSDVPSSTPPTSHEPTPTPSSPPGSASPTDPGPTETSSSPASPPPASLGDPTDAPSSPSESTSHRPRL